MSGCRCSTASRSACQHRLRRVDSSIRPSATLGHGSPAPAQRTAWLKRAKVSLFTTSKCLQISPLAKLSGHHNPRVGVRAPPPAYASLGHLTVPLSPLLCLPQGGASGFAVLARAALGSRQRRHARDRDAGVGVGCVGSAWRATQRGSVSRYGARYFDRGCAVYACGRLFEARTKPPSRST